MTVRGVAAIFDLARGDAIEDWREACGVVDPKGAGA